MSSDNVIFLAFDNPDMTPKSDRTLGACRVCSNKTFLMIYADAGFPKIRCASCQTDIGRVGWAPEP